MIGSNKLRNAHGIAWAIDAGFFSSSTTTDVEYAGAIIEVWNRHIEGYTTVTTTRKAGKKPSQFSISPT